MTTDAPPAPARQPFLHQLVSCVRAPAVALSSADGQVYPGGTEGLFRHDRRILSELIVDVDGHRPVPVGHHQPAAGAARFVAVVRHLGDPIPDPTVRVERERTVNPDGLTERLTLVNTARRAVSARLCCRVAVDFAPMDAVKSGRTATPVPPVWTGPSGGRWERDGLVLTLRATSEAAAHVDADGRLVLDWPVEVGPRDSWTVTVTVTADQRGPADPHAFVSPAAPLWPHPVTVSGPDDLVKLVDRGMADLEALTLTDADDPRNVFVAAGSPWFFTLFGRDSLWAARLTLPLGTELAGGTLRALARRQGTRHDPRTAEAPGKIPHEVRVEGVGGLPAVYFGSIDATALWICLLHDAWRWGMPASELTELLDPLVAALGWLVDEADADGDGFLEYIDLSGRGLANQGWKDSGDSIQFPDGTIATPPIALSEAQAYAYQAGMCGAALLEAHDLPGADRVRAWAGRLRERFREAFWVRDARGRFPAIALDGGKRPVDVAASNLGHLLGTGLLDPAEAADVAARLAQPDLDCGYGLRTLSADAAGFNPLGYHTGTVWPHDTAIAVHGLSREGHAAVAASLAGGLLRAAPPFEHRLPELYAGTAGHAGDGTLAYPASCRPQAWSAAVAVSLLQSALGLDVDVPNGTLEVRVRPEFRSWFPLRVEGLRLAGRPLAIAIDDRGRVEVETSAPVTIGVYPPEAARIPAQRSRNTRERAV